MQQVLFRIPDPTGNFPDGLPLYGYGAMLFVTFLACSWFGSRYARRAGIPKERMLDLAIWVFVWGIVGGRVTYMIVERVPLARFLAIWEGGLVIYGALIGGFISYWVFYLLFLKQIHVSSWRLGDVVAPGICVGLALGRLGCLLNGCCYGDVAPEGTPKLEFPLLTAPAKESVVARHHYQTVVGFSSDVEGRGDDVRTVVGKIEPLSAAERSGLKEGDRVAAFEILGRKRPNGGVLLVIDAPGVIDKVADATRKAGHSVEELDAAAPNEKRIKILVDDWKQFGNVRATVRQIAPVAGTRATDSFGDAIQNWPRGVESVALTVERGGQEVNLPPFTPRSLGLHPTQLYETISMTLLLFLLLAYYPFRRHNGQVFVLFMVGYAVHRFLNESIRDDTPGDFWFGLTFSQGISVLILLAAVVVELWLRATQPKRTVLGVDEYAAAEEPAKELVKQ